QSTIQYSRETRKLLQQLTDRPATENDVAEYVKRAGIVTLTHVETDERVSGPRNRDLPQPLDLRTGHPIVSRCGEAGIDPRLRHRSARGDATVGEILQHVADHRCGQR